MDADYDYHSSDMSSSPMEEDLLDDGYGSFWLKRRRPTEAEGETIGQRVKRRRLNPPDVKEDDNEAEWEPTPNRWLLWLRRNPESDNDFGLANTYRCHAYLNDRTRRCGNLVRGDVLCRHHDTTDFIDFLYIEREAYGAYPEEDGRFLF